MPGEVDDGADFLSFDAKVLGRPSGAMKADRSSRLDGPSSLMPWAIAAMFPLTLSTIGIGATIGSAEDARSGLTRSATVGAPVLPYRRRRDDVPLHTGEFPAVEARSEAPASETPATGATATEAHASEQTAAAQDAITAKEQVTAIQAALSLTVTEVAEVLGVARGTVHGWLKGSVPVPKMQENADRLRELHRVAMRWRERTAETLGRLVAAPVGDTSPSLLALLKADAWDDSAIQCTMETLAERLESQAVTQRALRERGTERVQSITPESIELERLRLRGLG